MADDKKSDNVPAEGLATSSDYVQIFLIEIEMKRGIDLIVADLNGKSDPYCRVSAFGRSYTTKTIMKTLNPVWNEKTQLCFFSDPKELKFDVYDWDKLTKDDPLGDTTLPISELFKPGSKGFSGKLKLKNVKKGEIEVCVECRKLLPIELEIRGQNLYQTLEEQKNTIISQSDSIRQYSDDNNDLTQDNATRNEHVNSLTNEKTELINRLADTRANSEKLNNTMTFHKQEKSDYESTLKTETDKLKQIRDSVADTKQNIDKYETDNEHLTQEIKTLKQSIEQKKQEIAEKKRKKEEEEEKANITAKKEAELAQKASSKPQSKTPDNNAKTSMADTNKANKSPAANKGCCIVL